VSNKRLEINVKRIVDYHMRVLIGLAHYDKGRKVKGCNCCYCAKGVNK
jgi:hypothetical protein